MREISCDEWRCRAGEVVGAEVGEVRVRIRVATCKGECSRRRIGCAETSGAGVHGEREIGGDRVELEVWCVESIDKDEVTVN